MHPDKARWEAKWSEKKTFDFVLIPFVREHLPLLQPGSVLDIPCGYGRNAVPLAEHGFQVTAVDISPTALRLLREQAAQRRLAMRIIEADITATDAVAALPVFDNILIARYKPSRALFAALVGKLRRGGTLLLYSLNNRPTLAEAACKADRYFLGKDEFLRISDALTLIKHETLTGSNGSCDGYIFRKHSDGVSHDGL
ncbi:MAG TPA: class I SAM-dependent methyltransferase [bacterium]|nr:class I SAM-dependent methyltransferase [bacterium]